MDWTPGFDDWCDRSLRLPPAREHFAPGRIQAISSPKQAMPDGFRDAGVFGMGLTRPRLALSGTNPPQIGDCELPFCESGSMLHAARNSIAARR